MNIDDYILQIEPIINPEIDDFEREVEALRGSQAFQKFLDERSACTRRIPLEEIEKEIEKELEDL